MRDAECGWWTWCQVAAAEALGAYARAYEMAPEAGRVERVTGRQVSILKDSPHAPSGRGAALALGHLPAQLLEPTWRHVIAAVCGAATGSVRHRHFRPPYLSRVTGS